MMILQLSDSDIHPQMNKNVRINRIFCVCFLKKKKTFIYRESYDESAI